jgi:hypothetical protein
MKKIYFILTLLFILKSNATICNEPQTTEDHFFCENIISSEIKGDLLDKISSINNIPIYSLWLNTEKNALCINGKIKNIRGTGVQFGESKLPQITQQVFPTQKKVINITESYWILSFQGFVVKNQNTLFPNYPENYDHINLNLKTLILKISKPIGIKSFAIFELSCINKKETKKNSSN